MRLVLESLYKSIFNYWVRKNGYTSLTPTLASICSTLVLLILFFDILFLINIFEDNIIRFNVNKGILWLSILLAVLLNHVLYFDILRIPKAGKTNDLLFEVDDRKSGRILKFVVINTIVFVVLVFTSIFVSYARS